MLGVACSFTWLIHVLFIELSVVPFPISPFALYPTVYTVPFMSAIAPDWYP